MKAFLCVLNRGGATLSKKAAPVRPQVCEGLVDPNAWARYFADSVQSRGFRLDFSFESLAIEVDRFLDSSLFLNYNQIVAEANLSHCNKLRDTLTHQRAQRLYLQYLEYETGLSAYIGETLKLAYEGSWSGPFSATAPLYNQYLSRLILTGRIYYPSRYPAMRLTGAHFQTGRLREQLTQLLAGCSQA